MLPRLNRLVTLSTIAVAIFFVSSTAFVPPYLCYYTEELVAPLVSSPAKTFIGYAVLSLAGSISTIDMNSLSLAVAPPLAATAESDDACDEELKCCVAYF